MSPDRAAVALCGAGRRADAGDCLSPNCFNATQQLIRSHAALALVAINFFAVNEYGHVSGAAGLDAGFDSELGLCSSLQAHGRAAQIHSKETALDFDVHGITSSLSLYC